MTSRSRGSITTRPRPFVTTCPCASRRGSKRYPLGEDAAGPVAALSGALDAHRRRLRLALRVLVVPLADQDDADDVLQVRVVLKGPEPHVGTAEGEEDLGEVVGGDALPASEPVGVLDPDLGGAERGGEADRVILRGGEPGAAVAVVGAFVLVAVLGEPLRPSRSPPARASTRWVGVEPFGSSVLFAPNVTKGMMSCALTASPPQRTFAPWRPRGPVRQGTRGSRTSGIASPGRRPRAVARLPFGARSTPALP
jgi:hypothetical protein